MLETLDTLTTRNAQRFSIRTHRLQNFPTVPAQDLAPRMAQEPPCPVIPSDNFRIAVDRESRFGSMIDQITAIEHWEFPDEGFSHGTPLEVDTIVFDLDQIRPGVPSRNPALSGGTDHAPFRVLRRQRSSAMIRYGRRRPRP
jgi:hypothetical protein